MAIFYRLYKMLVHQKGQSSYKYLARVKKLRTVSNHELAERIARNQSLKVSDMEAALAALADEMHDQLQNGNTVYLEGIGKFYLSFQSNMVDSPKEFRKNRDIHHLKVNFTADGKRDADTWKINREITDDVEIEEMP